MFRCRSGWSSSMRRTLPPALRAATDRIHDVRPTPLSELSAPLEAAIAEVGGDGAPVRLERPADAAHGDYASAVALSLAPALRSSPRDIAGRIGERVSSPWIESVEVAGPGFI